ncbi:uncharacterized protein LOC101890523 [Musca domestica]|uniref:Uncharacterized protein LOC101890523 n=1 Tax=Musca domestica TaxID=7370 RepID=A0A1I8MEN0_MUSDO|nr:uncharacterized protein LOC101890523 [Musca domestica]
MPSFCAVVNCNDRYGHSENISFHKFPLKRKDLLEQWESFIQKQRGPDWRASRWSSLCSRHFREDDFRSFNERKTLKKTAVPSVLDVGNYVESHSRNKPIYDGNVLKDKESQKDKEFKEIMAIREQLEDVEAAASSNIAKTNCRLCGVSSVPVVTFASNYELYGMLQKCFPTLNIQQDDAFPKVLCSACYKNLQHFCEFVDIVWAAQTELQKKYKLKAVEKPPLKIKQEPLAVRVKQEVAEVGYDQQQQELGANDEYDVMADGQHDETEGGEAVDQKYEFCDFPINDCDIMEIINLDDPFINIPDDDNNTIVNESEESPKRVNEQRSNHMLTAHELLQVHLLMDEHNYAYVDTDDFKEEQQVYKTEKSDGDERTFTEHPNLSDDNIVRQNENLCKDPAYNYISDPSYSETNSFENRALKPIVTSVSAIQQPTSKGNGIVVLNESIVKSGAGGCQLHACMVCHLKFFSVENLKEHYTQTHGTPMVTVPTSNILVERNSTESKCHMKTEVIENLELSSAKEVYERPAENLEKLAKDIVAETNENPKGNTNEEENTKMLKNSFKIRRRDVRGDNVTQMKQRQTNYRRRNIVKKNPHKISLNTMANQYQQLRKLYQTLQKKCLNLEQNVEQLQLQPTKKYSRTIKDRRKPKIAANSDASTENKNFTCPVCSKFFPNANSLRQHSITHTEERKHICSLCQRCFKRRNGLLQHLKGFHLQVKPFTCQVCKHSYALKCDMLRCKHSALKASVVFNKCS